MMERIAQPPIASVAYARERITTERIRIAVADDHPMFRDGLCGVLELEDGFEIAGKASSGEEALSLIERQHPQILLLDLSMPGMGGLAALRRLRELASDTKVIVLTASENREDLVEAMQLGASGIVLKHDLTSVLVKSIRRVHAGEIWLHTSTTQAVMQRPDPAPPAPSIPVPPRLAQDRSGLTRKETEVAKLVAQGLRNREIANRMFISEQTVKNHLRSIFEKLHVGDRLELALYTIHHMPDP
jgi:DNA-binding NarL/FixJ family response regulator